MNVVILYTVYLHTECFFNLKSGELIASALELYSVFFYNLQNEIFSKRKCNNYNLYSSEKIEDKARLLIEHYKNSLETVLCKCSNATR